MSGQSAGELFTINTGTIDYGAASTRAWFTEWETPEKTNSHTDSFIILF